MCVFKINIYLSGSVKYTHIPPYKPVIPHCHLQILSVKQLPNQEKCNILTNTCNFSRKLGSLITLIFGSA